MISRLLFIVRRRWPILVVLPLLAGIVGFLLTPQEDSTTARTWTSTVVIAVDQATTSSTAAQQAILEAEQGAIAAAAAEEVDGLSGRQVGRRVEGSFDADAFVISLEVSGGSAAEAERLARAVSDAFLDQANSGSVDDREDTLASANATLDAARDDLDQFLVANQGPLTAPDPPLILLNQRTVLEQEVEDAEAALREVEDVPPVGVSYGLIDIGPGSRSAIDNLALPASLGVRVTLGVVLGLIGAGLVVLLVEKLNPRIDDPEHAAALIGAPVLAMVPVMNRRRREVIERADLDRFHGPFAESFRSMRSHLEFREQADDRDTPPRIMITSATPGEGKSTTTAFLGLSYAETDRPTIVVGADIRRPAVHKLFEIDRVPGLSSRVISGGETVPLQEIVKRDERTGVLVVPSGPAVDRVTGLVGDVDAVTSAGQASGRVVLVDTAPIMVANDAIDFLSAVDWVIVVVRVGRSTERSVKQMMQTLNLSGADVAGVVMVGSLESSDAKRYYYSYYADDTGGRRSVARTPPTPPAEGPVPVSGTLERGG